MGTTREIKEVYIAQKRKKKLIPLGILQIIFFFFCFIPPFPSTRYKVFKIKITAHKLPGRTCVTPKNLIRLSSQGNKVELMISSVATIRPKNNRNARISYIENRIKCTYCRLDTCPELFHAQTFPREDCTN